MAHPPITTLGHIEDIRIERCWSMNELARRSGIGSGHLSNIERDAHRHVSVYTVGRIASALEVSMDDLLEGI